MTASPVISLEIHHKAMSPVAGMVTTRRAWAASHIPSQWTPIHDSVCVSSSPCSFLPRALRHCPSREAWASSPTAGSLLQLNAHVNYHRVRPHAHLPQLPAQRPFPIAYRTSHYLKPFTSFILIYRLLSLREMTASIFSVLSSLSLALEENKKTNLYLADNKESIQLVQLVN